MSLLAYAEQELNAFGYTPTDEEGPNKWMRANVLELIKVFAQQGHSGSSAPHCVGLFTKLANYEPLLPVEDEGWVEVGDGVLQNQRCSALFKNLSESDKAHYLDAIIWEDEKGLTWSGLALLPDGTKIGSSQYVKFPFIPKTFYVKVRSVEVAPDDWEFYVADPSALDAVAEYYDVEFKR